MMSDLIARGSIMDAPDTAVLRLARFMKLPCENAVFASRALRESVFRQVQGDEDESWLVAWFLDQVPASPARNALRR